MKNFSYLLAGIIISALILNPSYASQIKSNLVKGFIAITSDNTKAQNNLVGLDAGGKLPIDILPASAASGDSKNGGWCQSMMVQKSDLSSIYANCGEGYSKSIMRGYSRAHPTGFGTPGGSTVGSASTRNGQSQRYHASVCCMPK